MQTVYITLPTGRDVQDFVEQLTGLEGSFDIIDGSYILDARSLMGIFSLDLSKPLRLDIGLDTPATLRALQRFITTPPNVPAKEGKANDGHE